VAEEARRLWGWGHDSILLRLNSIEDNGVVSHPFGKGRGMDGAPAADGPDNSMNRRVRLRNLVSCSEWLVSWE
jgi:hypothetical protein